MTQDMAIPALLRLWRSCCNSPPMLSTERIKSVNLANRLKSRGNPSDIWAERKSRPITGFQVNRIVLFSTVSVSFSDLLVSVMRCNEGDCKTLGSKVLGEMHHGSYVTLRWVWEHKSMQGFRITSHLIVGFWATNIARVLYIECTTSIPTTLRR